MNSLHSQRTHINSSLIDSVNMQKQHEVSRQKTHANTFDPTGEDQKSLVFQMTPTKYVETVDMRSVHSSIGQEIQKKQASPVISSKVTTKLATVSPALR